MAKTTDRLYDTADTVRPYVDRALHDDDLRDNLKEAFNAARDVYTELLGNRNLTATATRVATDKEIQESLKRAVDELREASRRVQGKEDHGARNTMLLLAGITAGILFNPMTGPQTRKWLLDKVTGESGDFDYAPPAATTGSNGPTATGNASSGA
jgi:gas vesicle protein